MLIKIESNSNLRALRKQDDEREREEWRINYEEELRQRDKRLQEIRQAHLDKENEKKKKRKLVKSPSAALSKKNENTRNPKRLLMPRDQNTNMPLNVEGINGQEVFPIIPKSEKGYHRLPKKHWSAVLPQEVW